MLPVLKEKGTHMIDQIITAPATAHQIKVMLLTTDQKETSRLMTVVSPQSLNFLCSFWPVCKYFALPMSTQILRVVGVFSPQIKL